MGFRSTMVTEDIGLGSLYLVPDWFLDKYIDVLNFNGCLSTKEEIKFQVEIEVDILKMITEIGRKWIDLVWLHEDGTLTRTTISNGEITYFDYTEPTIHT